MLLTVVVKIDCTRSQKTSSDVKHLLSDCFAVDRFYNGRHTSTRLFTIWKVLQLNHLFWHLKKVYNWITYFDIWQVLYSATFGHQKNWTKGMFICKSELCYISINPQIKPCYPHMKSCPAQNYLVTLEWLIEKVHVQPLSVWVMLSRYNLVCPNDWPMCVLCEPNQQNFWVAFCPATGLLKPCFLFASFGEKVKDRWNWFTKTMFFSSLFFLFPQACLSLQLLGKFL